ncbi:MAG TPA: crosslink repair DNA glycosylase YcaQ family protein, partial [Dehalococcoidia bacterium]|nr:crosslink repair DNA glycosylase YcaQ family protein [Dehalococcoidia bacterium]
MKRADIVQRRLLNQRLSRPDCQTPAEVARCLGAVQAQDYPGALWAIALRMGEPVSEAAVEAAIADKSIVRTWPMRGTLHFVPAEDARWMLDLLTPRLRGRFARRYEELGLDESAFGRGGEIIQAALQGGKIMTRPEA